MMRLYTETFFHHIFEIVTAGDFVLKSTKLSNADANLGLKELFAKHNLSDKVLGTQFCDASAIVQATTGSDVALVIPSAEGMIQKSSCRVTMPMDEFLLKVVQNYGDRILLKESDKRPKTSKKKGKKRSPINGINKVKHLEKFDEWQGISPWDPSVGGDGCPKFLCDVMVSILTMNI